MKSGIEYSRKDLETKPEIVKKLGLHKRSITPTTLKAIEFEKSEEDVYFKEHYNYKSNNVTRFGLNDSSKELSFIVEEYNKIKKDSIDTKSLTSIASEKNSLKNIDTITNYQKNSSKILTKLEFVNTNMAIDYLKTGTKVALVDIFDRDADYNVKIDMETSLYKTHTVVLYEKSGKYLVIDPSNATFSYALAGAHEDIRLCFSNKLQIYKPEGEIGPKQNQYRDCIDVAVKLAFNLMLNSKLGFDDIVVKELGNNVGYIDFQSIKDNPSIKEITNQKEIYKKLYDVVKDHPIRIKQSSDVLDTKKATSLLTTLESVSSELSTKLKEKDFIHSFKALSFQEEKLVNTIFSEHNYKTCLEKSISTFSEVLDEPFYNIIKDEIQLLAMEFYYIDKIE